jgi:secondary thiamine-phosphate synthase enzyme
MCAVVFFVSTVSNLARRMFSMFSIFFRYSGDQERIDMTFQKRITVSTRGHGDIHDLTEQVGEIVGDAGVAAGTVHVFNVGSTGAIGTIEFEPGLGRDLPEILDELIPPRKDYGHEEMWHDGNGHSHLQASWLGPSLTVPVSDGRMALGRWQQIFLLECDIRPRERTIVVTVSG